MAYLFELMDGSGYSMMRTIHLELQVFHIGNMGLSIQSATILFAQSFIMWMITYNDWTLDKVLKRNFFVK
jgi:hypothetical protein